MNYPHGRPEYLDEVCANCGGERGLHNHMNQACPKDPNANRDHTEYRTTTFAAQPNSVLGETKDRELIYKQEQLLEKQELEIERLKRVIEKLFKDTSIGEYWEQFKKENGL